jgi:hypothetical protein
MYTARRAIKKPCDRDDEAVVVPYDMPRSAMF